MEAVFRAKAKMAAAAVLLATATTVVAAAGAPLDGKPAPARPAPTQETQAEASPPAPGGDGQIILNETCYMRTCHQFDWDRYSAELLKNGKEASSPTPRELQGLERSTKSRLTHLNLDWTKMDWRDYAVSRAICGNGGIVVPPESEKYMNAPPPAANWMQPEFDDNDWPRQRQPYLVGRTKFFWGVIVTTVRANYHRMKFFVPDPARAGDLELRLVYHGGVRVFVNGREAGRAHVPAGDYDLSATAQEYPQEAYARTPAEMSPEAQKKMDLYLAGKADRWPWNEMLIPDLFGVPPPLKNGMIECKLDYGVTTITPATWQRVQGLRDRIYTVKIPAALLKQGENTLALEVRAAAMNPFRGIFGGGGGCLTWPHVQLCSFQLLGPSRNLPSMAKRPEGVQVWTVDPQYRLHDTEWGDPGSTISPIRMIGARNGTYSGQIGIGTDRDLKNLKVVPGELKRDGGGAIPSASLRAFVMQPHALDELSGLCGGRSKTISDPMEAGELPLQQHALVSLEGLSRERCIKLMAEIRFFDQIGADGPKDVSAGKCQGVWVSLAVPPDAQPGKYAGSVKIEADGMQPVLVPVEAGIVDWRLPDPRDFRTVMALEQSPYGVAKTYNVKVWSEEHFKLLENSFRLLGRVGNQYVFIPVLSWTELGNRDDSPIRWIRAKSGSLRFDYTIMDRYLDLVLKHWGVPKVISFVIMHGNPANPGEVQVLDETTGKVEPMKVGSGLPESDRRHIWGAFGVSLYGHMRAKGLEKSMFWGYAWDSEGDPMLVPLMAEFTPGVFWSMGGHDMRNNPRIYTAFSWIYKTGQSQSIVDDGMGWKNPRLEFNNPRVGGSVLCLPGSSAPFAFRLAVDRALTVGCRGLGRVGADYWKESFYDGTRGGEGYLQPGMETHVMLWPGSGGADSSARYEALVEGVQEEQARIFIGQMLDRKMLPKDLADRAQAAVLAHVRETACIPAGNPCPKQLEYGMVNWQQRSRRLYQTAADVASVAGLDVDQSSIAADLPARSKSTVSLKLRNWTGKPRVWKVEAKEPWLVPDKADGSTETVYELKITVDAGKLEPGKQAKGTVTVTDTASGKSYPVALAINVSKVLDVSLAQVVFNIAPGERESREFTVLNYSDKPLNWQSAVSHPWLKLDPSGGILAAGETKLVAVSAQPSEKTAAALDGKLTVSEIGGVESRDIVVKAIVVPPYQPPAGPPQGEAILLDKVDRKFLARHDIVLHGELPPDHYVRTNDKDKPRCGPKSYLGFDLGDTSLKGFKTVFETALWVRPHAETVYKLEGSGFKAFSAYVGFPKEMKNPQMYRDARVSFEIAVDGKTVAQSGFVTLNDEPRLLTVGDLATAREIMLVTRLDNLKDSIRCVVFWADPKFYK